MIIAAQKMQFGLNKQPQPPTNQADMVSFLTLCLLRNALCHLLLSKGIKFGLSPMMLCMIPNALQNVYVQLFTNAEVH